MTRSNAAVTPRSDAVVLSLGLFAETIISISVIIIIIICYTQGTPMTPHMRRK